MPSSHHCTAAHVGIDSFCSQWLKQNRVVRQSEILAMMASIASFLKHLTLNYISEKV